LNFPTLKRYFQNQYVLSRNDLRKEIPETLSKIGLGFCGILPNTIHYLPSGDQIGIFTFYGDSGNYAFDGKKGKAYSISTIASSPKSICIRYSR
jgi:hypothetical protein